MRGVAKLSVGNVVRESVRSYRRDWWYLTLLALLFEGPLVLIEVAVHAATDFSITIDGGIDVAEVRSGVTCLFAGRPVRRAPCSQPKWHVWARLMCHGGAMPSGADGTQKPSHAL